MSVLDYLKSDPVVHADMLDVLDRPDTSVLAEQPDGVLLGVVGSHWLLSAASPETARLLIRAASQTPEPHSVVTHQLFDIPVVAEMLGFDPNGTDCHQAAFLGKAEDLPPLPRNDLLFEYLGADYLDVVFRTYTLGENRDYVRARLDDGTVLGAFLPDSALEPELLDPFSDTPADLAAHRTLTGFMGLHDEGSMGMLEVLPRFRRQQIAECLELKMATERIASGLIPYGQVIAGNTASLGLQRKLGFAVSDPVVTWLHR